MTVNGAVAQIGCKVDDGDSVAVDGRVIGQKRAPHTYIMLHKPRGYITTMKDEQGRRCVADLLTGLPDSDLHVGGLHKTNPGVRTPGFLCRSAGRHACEMCDNCDLSE